MRGARPSGCSGDAQRVRPLEKMRRDAVQEHSGAGIGLHDLPAPVDHDAGKRVVGAEHPLDPFADGGHIRIVERPFAVHRRKTCGQQQLVLFAQRNVEDLGQPQHHRTAGRRPPGLDEADVAGRDVGLDREIELAQAAALSPFPHQRAERRCLHVDGGHGAQCCAPSGRDHYVWGNCRAYLCGPWATQLRRT